MRILILGGAGMVGHKLWQHFRDRHECWATIRGQRADYSRFGLFEGDRVLPGVDAFAFDTVTEAFGVARPDVVINCIGVVKQLPEAGDPIVSLTLNSLFPHRVAQLCGVSGARLIHISTDCVFSGRRGGYREDDPPDAVDLYGKSKHLGEVTEPGCLTIRTSVIGRELGTSNGLVEWFLSCRRGRVPGFTGVTFSGFTTRALARILGGILERPLGLTGVYHVSSEPIRKYDLLILLNKAFGPEVTIEPDGKLQIDRSLDSTRFRRETGFSPPGWEEMVQDMAADPTPYEAWRAPSGI